ncbi:MAG: hypothetical protein ACOH2M_32595 [Cypionkella sp.]
MPKLIKLYITNVAYGFALSAVFLALLLWTDVGGLRHLIFGSDIGGIAAVMMFVMNGVVFASVQFAIAVMRMAEDPEGPTRGNRAPDVSRPIRVGVPAKGKVAGPQRP